MESFLLCRRNVEFTGFDKDCMRVVCRICMLTEHLVGFASRFEQLCLSAALAERNRWAVALLAGATGDQHEQDVASYVLLYRVILKSSRRLG